MVEATDNPVLVGLERQAAEPAPSGAARSDRLVGWFAAGVLALAIALIVFVPVAHWLAERDIGSARGLLLQAAGVAAQDEPLKVGAGLFAAGALLGAAENSILSRRMLKLTRQRPVTGHYASTIEKLGSGELDVRIGGIYALERVACDSATDYPAVMEVLTAFIHEHSREPWPLRDSGDLEQEQRVRPDVQAALTVIGRRMQERDVRAIDLILASLIFADLRGAFFRGAFLSGAHLARANLTGANLIRVNLRGADLTRANLTGADLHGANLTRANLTGADLHRANLDGADLRCACLTGADLTGADLTGARWSEGAPVPDGWKLDTSPGRLERVDTGSEPNIAGC